MYIKCWGSRGSIPVSGKEYIKYGGDTTCMEIRAQSGDVIIIDAGSGIRRLGNKIINEDVTRLNLIFTHAHWDHIMGFPFFKPIYDKRYEIHMHRCPIPKYVEKMLSKVMTAPNFPVRYSDIEAAITYEKNCVESFEIGSVTISPIPLSHPNTGSGYKFEENGKTFVFITDNELGFIHATGLAMKEYAEFSRGADLFIHDAEYTPREYKSTVEWGHSTYTSALDLAMRAEVARFGLFHLNQDRTDRQMDSIVLRCRKKIGKKGLKMECFGVASGMEFNL